MEPSQPQLGMLALGAYTDPMGLESERAQRDLKTGKALTYTCYQMLVQTQKFYHD